MSLKPKGRILYVEDDADNRELITLLLKGDGYEVIPTEDAVEALKIVRRIPFDLYIVDIRLPGMSGLELCKKLCESDGNKPVLIFSAAAYDGDKKRAFECGASAYLVKPLDTEDLVREVNRIISSNGHADQKSTRDGSSGPQ
jgi:DNA-binding response OmpR family regulator